MSKVRERHWSREILGLSSLSLLTMTVGGVLAFAYINLVLVPNPASSPSEVMSAAGLPAAISVVFLMLATARVSRSQSNIEIVGLFYVTCVPVSEIRDVEYENGFSLVLYSGRRLGSITHGASLFGLVTGHRRSRDLAEKVKNGLPSQGEARASFRQVDLTSRFRVLATVGSLSFGLLLWLLPVVIHVARK